MKLLKKYLADERIDLEDGEVKLSMIPVTTSQQARLVDLSMQHGVAGRIEQTNWCLKNCVEKISVSGIEFKPAELCDSADLSDQSTVAVYIKIGKMVISNAFAQEDELGK